MAESVKHVLRIAAAIVVLLLMCGPNPALTASGGRMGGRSFPARYKKPSVQRKAAGSSWRSYRKPTTTKIKWDWSPSPPPSYAPAAAGSNSTSLSSISKLDLTDVVVISVLAAVTVIGLSTAILLWVEWVEDKRLTDEHKRRTLEYDRIVAGYMRRRRFSPPREKATVLKLQILGKLGIGRSVQKELNQIAETADTSTKNGIHCVLTDTVIALLRHPEYFISAYTSVDVKKSLKAGKKGFEEQSVTERAKFDEETLVNVNNKQKRTPSAPTEVVSGNANEYIVITILVAARGVLKLPSIESINELKESLQNLASIPLDSTLAVEVLWTPQNEADTLSEQELLRDYPFLKPF